MLQSHHATIPYHKMKFCGIVVFPGGNKSKNVFDILLLSVRCSSFKKSAKPGARVDILFVKKSTKTVSSLDLK